MSPRNNGRINGLYGGDARGLYGSGSYGRRNTMIYGKPRPKWPKFLLLIAIIVIVIVCIYQFACSGSDEDQTKQEAEQQKKATETTQTVDVDEQETGVDASITITAVGDCTLGTDPTFGTANTFVVKYNEVEDPSKYFFQRVTRFTEEDDLTIANFEGTLTECEDRAPDKQFCFKAPAKYAQILTEGSVEAVTLANNHTFDYGQQGYDDTKSALAAQNITTFGFDRTNTYEVNGVKVGLLGINATAGYDNALTLTKQNVDVLKEAGCNIIIGTFHWGNEGEYEATAEQVNLAHAAVDYGVDLVLGTHPHVLQGIEQYNGRYILYSLGNFCFGGNDHPADFATMMWQQTFTFSNGELVINEETTNAVSVIPCRVSSSSTTLNDYQPLPVGGSDATKVLKKVNKYSKKLSGQAVIFEKTVDDDNRASIKKVRAAATTESPEASSADNTTAEPAVSDATN